MNVLMFSSIPSEQQIFLYPYLIFLTYVYLANISAEDSETGVTIEYEVLQVTQVRAYVTWVYTSWSCHVYLSFFPGGSLMQVFLSHLHGTCVRYQFFRTDACA